MFRSDVERPGRSLQTGQGPSEIRLLGQLSVEFHGKKALDYDGYFCPNARFAMVPSKALKIEVGDKRYVGTTIWDR